MSGAQHTAVAAPRRGTATLPQRAIRRYDARARRIERSVLLAITGIPLLGAAGGLWLLAEGRLRAVDHTIFAAMYFATGFGITVGYHRLLAHHAFRTGPILRGALAVAGAMAIQGPVMRWVADHRRHHGWTDRPGDPHSPYPDAHSEVRSASGLWHAHLGWFFAEEKSAVRTFAPDLLRDPVVTAVDRLYPVWTLLSLAIPAALGFAADGADGAYRAFLWGGLTRVFVVQHVTWSINSIGHSFGARRFATPDASRNNKLLAWLALGEGWHNNHHAFPRSAIQGLRRNEVDLSGLLLRALERLGLVWNLHRPPVDGVATRDRS